MRHIVTLHTSDGSTIGSMAVKADRHGLLPAVIVDPRDTEGRTMPGLWLGDTIGQLHGTTYRQIASQAPSTST